MTPKFTTRQFKQAIRAICVPLDLSHAVTLTLWDQYRNLQAATSVARRFKRNFNKAIWGGNSYAKGKAALSWVAIVQGNPLSQNLHLHCAVGNFKSKYDERELKRRFGRAVRLTPGIAVERDFAPLRSKKKWINYISRELTVGNDEYALIDQFDRGITPRSYQQGTAAPVISDN